MEVGAALVEHRQLQVRAQAQAQAQAQTQTPARAHTQGQEQGQKQGQGQGQGHASSNAGLSAAVPTSLSPPISHCVHTLAYDRRSRVFSSSHSQFRHSLPANGYGDAGPTSTTQTLLTPAPLQHHIRAADADADAAVACVASVSRHMR
jgi:hypothetical protein